MALTTAQKHNAWQRLIADMTATSPMTLTQPELLAAATGLDDYLDANATQINNAIPHPARGALTVQQKALMLAAVALERYGPGS